MLKSDAIAHFDGDVRALARAINLSTVAIYRWGRVVPYWSAQDIARITQGGVHVRHELYERGRPLKGKRLTKALARSRGTANDDAAPAVL